jgi:hypothetical protein
VCLSYYHKYNLLRDEILKSEQHLLRLLNFKLENKYEAYYQLLFLTLKNVSSPILVNNTATGVYNDRYIKHIGFIHSFFVKELQKIKEDWKVLFSIYYAYKIECEPDWKPSVFELAVEKKLETDGNFKTEYTSNEILLCNNIRF